MRAARPRAAIRSGDTLIVVKLDRLGRSTRDVLNLVHELEQKGANLRVLEPAIVGLLVGCGLAAIVAPALACQYDTTAQNSQSTSQETAQSQPASDTGSN